MKALENPALDLDLRTDIADVALAAVNTRIAYLLECKLLDRGLTDAEAVIDAMRDSKEKYDLLAELIDEAVAGLMLEFV